MKTRYSSKILQKKLKVEYYINSFDTDNYINKNKVSVQMAARELRYQWFSELMHENALDYLVTAHQADDDLETFLINLSRGTGLEGLSGIPEETSTIIRPFLHFSRAQIMSYARKNQISWREDTSNADTKYLRNKIRHEIVPKLKELHPTFDKNFSRTQEFLAGTVEVLEYHIGELKSKLFQQQNDHVEIDVAHILTLQPLKPYVYLLFKEYGFREWDNVNELLTAQSGKELRSATHRLIKDREHLLLQELSQREDSADEYFLDNTDVELPVRLKQREVEKISENSREILYVDKETLNDRLSVRKWKKGDYFYPLGMRGKKKLSKFFKDEKLDMISKETQWLLCSGEDIVWVIGRRADERFRVTDKTKTILKFSLVV